MRDSSLVETCCVMYTEGLFHYKDLGLGQCSIILYSLASQPYFSSCACAGERGRGKGRKNTSGKMCRVFVSKPNVNLLRCFPKSHDMDAGRARMFF